MVCLIGLAIVGFVKATPTRYAACFLTIMGCTSNIPLLLTFASNNVHGQNARAINHAAVALGALRESSPRRLFDRQ